MAGRNYGLRGLRFVLLILVPALPSILAGLKIGWAFAWRTLIAAELVFGASSGKGGLGWYIFQNRNELYTDKVFAGLAVVVLIGLLVENLVFGSIERLTVKRWGATLGRRTGGVLRQLSRQLLRWRGGKANLARTRFKGWNECRSPWICCWRSPCSPSSLSLTPGRTTPCCWPRGQLRFRPSIPHILGISCGFFIMVMAGLRLGHGVRGLPGAVHHPARRRGLPAVPGLEDRHLRPGRQRPGGTWQAVELLGARGGVPVGQKAWVMAVGAINTVAGLLHQRGGDLDGLRPDQRADHRNLGRFRQHAAQRAAIRAGCGVQRRDVLLVASLYHLAENHSA